MDISSKQINLYLYLKHGKNDFLIPVSSTLHYIKKIEKKGRTKKELHQVIEWLTGFDDHKLQEYINQQVTFKIFFPRSKFESKC